MGRPSEARALRHAGRSGIEVNADYEPTPSPSQEGSRAASPVPLLGGVRGGLVSARPNSRCELEKLAFIALGSNLGDPKQNVLRAMDRLQELSDSPLIRSSLWQSTPVDCPPGSPSFINAVVGLLPGPCVTAESLLDRLQSLEQEFGRRPKRVLNEPRPLDLDLICFRQELRDSKRLTLPHPRAHLRRFVLQPLSEIAADLVFPGQLLSVRQLFETLHSPEKTFRLNR